MKDIFDRASAGVGEDEAVTLKFLLIKYREVFAEHDIDLGDYSAVKHVIDTRDTRPVKQRPRRTPVASEGEEKKHLKTFGRGYYFQNGRALQCWLGRRMALSDIVLI